MIRTDILNMYIEDVRVRRGPEINSDHYPLEIKTKTTHEKYKEYAWGEREWEFRYQRRKVLNCID